MAVPGSYTVSLSQRVDGIVTELAPATPFEIAPLFEPAIAAQDKEAVLAFQRQTGELVRAVSGTQRAAAAAMDRKRAMKRALQATPNASEELRGDVRALELRLMDLQERLNGDRTQASRSEGGMPGIVGRVNTVVGGHWRALHGPTQTHRDQYEIAAAEFSAVYGDIKRLVETDLPAFEARMEAAGAPWTTGRALPDWTPPEE